MLDGSKCREGKAESGKGITRSGQGGMRFSFK